MNGSVLNICSVLILCLFGTLQLKAQNRSVDEGMDSLDVSAVNAGEISSEEVKHSEHVIKPEAVDLGLSVRWASFNIGAAAPEEYGWYYAWGDTLEREVCMKYSYLYYDRQWDDYMDIGQNISGTDYDVAYRLLGKGWRIPTREEMQELIEKCSWTWIVYNGVVEGYRIKGPNGNKIFLPASGFKKGKRVSGQGLKAVYWIGTKRQENHNMANCLYFYSGDVYWCSSNACFYGCSVRPVFDSQSM